MSDVFRASIRDELWHSMRQDLAKFVPGIAENQLLMCCACGRFLPQKEFTLEHLIPQQALKQDPEIVRKDPLTPVNTRAKNILLCKKRLFTNGQIFYRAGCNSWKGRYYDTIISNFIAAKKIDPNNCTDTHIIAALSLAYLAMVAEFGYIVTLMRSGRLMREQFFKPRHFHKEMPLSSQVVLGGDAITSADAPIWTNPFSFDFPRSGLCVVAARNFGVMLPLSRDPREPIATHLPIVPSRYRLLPDFSTVFD